MLREFANRGLLRLAGNVHSAYLDGGTGAGSVTCQWTLTQTWWVVTVSAQELMIRL
ncbi:hypothetical protein GCM10010307_02260 [Streptomyces vastus]|uniref:Uncharacterized protein n=1 Tax=Streptomyces vastus TaxID=285451 RepID=A0ABP6CK84_9ACTN